MKSTLFTTHVAALMAVVLLQAGDAAAASPVAAAESRIPGSAVNVAEAGSSVSGNAGTPPRNTDNSVARAKKRKPLEPAIHNTVRALVSTSHQGLVEEKTSRGVEMKLRGRFRTAPVATLEDDGTITIRDYTSVPAAE